MVGLSDLFRVVLGTQLTGVWASYLTIPGSTQSETPQSVWLVFRDGRTLRLTTAADGESILCDTASPGEDDRVDMGEDGRLEVVDVSSRPPWDVCCGHSLTAVSKLVLGRSDIGVDLLFGSSRATIFNWGDTLHVRADLAPSFLQTERIEHVTIDI
jgi:hypothetical protein